MSGPDMREIGMVNPADEKDMFSCPKCGRTGQGICVVCPPLPRKEKFRVSIEMSTFEVFSDALAVRDELESRLRTACLSDLGVSKGTLAGGGMGCGAIDVELELVKEPEVIVACATEVFRCTEAQQLTIRVRVED